MFGRSRPGDDDMAAFICDEAPGLLRRARLLTADPHLAEDLTQETLTTVVAKWPRVQRLDDRVPYTHRILLNTFIDWSRRRSFSERPSETITDGSTATDGLDGISVDLARVSTLPPEHRAVVVMRYYDDLPVADVAAALGRSEAWVRQVSHRTTGQLRDSSHLADEPDVPVPHDPVTQAPEHAAGRTPVLRPSAVS